MLPASNARSVRPHGPRVRRPTASATARTTPSGCVSAAADSESRLSALVGRLERRTSADLLPALRDSASPPRAAAPARRSHPAADDRRRRARPTARRCSGPASSSSTTPRQSRRGGAPLEASGFDAITASNGLEGVIVAHYARPSSILMDVTMPVLDGLEAAAPADQASEVTRDMKLIAYTAHARLLRRPFAKLFVGVLAKPVDPDVESSRRSASTALQTHLIRCRGRCDEILRDIDEELRQYAPHDPNEAIDSSRRDAAARLPIPARPPRLRRHRPRHAGARRSARRRRSSRSSTPWCCGRCRIRTPPPGSVPHRSAPAERHRRVRRPAGDAWRSQWAAESPRSRRWRSTTIAR